MSTDQSPLHKRSPITFQNKCITRPSQIILSVNTLFTFDFKVHEAFDYGPNERLINKYPELIRYIIDAQDKDWFIQQRILSPIHRTLQIMLLTIEEVNRIAHSDILKNQPYPKPIELLGFKIPEFMLQKMRKFIAEQSESSKTIIANTIHPNVSLSALLSAAPKPTAIKTIQSIKPILVYTNLIQHNFLMTSSKFDKHFSFDFLFLEASIGKYNVTIVSDFVHESQFTADYCSIAWHQRKWIENGNHYKRIHYIRRRLREFACHRKKLIKFIACHFICIVIEFTHRKNTKLNCIKWNHRLNWPNGTF